MNKKQLILPISILLGCIILGGFYYASEINKQRSIEKQQQIKITQDKQNRLDEKISECTSFGLKKAAIDKKEKEELNKDNMFILYTYTEPSFYYNEKMNACLYRIEKNTSHLSPSFLSIKDFQVINLITNKIEVSFYGENKTQEEITKYNNANRIADMVFDGKTVDEASKDVLELFKELNSNK